MSDREHEHAGHHHDEHAHGEGHGHHDHHHAVPADFSRAFLVGIILNLGFVFVEGAYGIISNSISLLADAGHNLGDVLGLALAWVAAHLSKKDANDKFSYGYKSSSIVAALLNSSLLFIAIGAILWEATRRLFHPDPPLTGTTMMVVAGIGIIINAMTALMFFRGKDHDLNINAAFLHMMADAFVSLGVVLTGFLFLKTGWSWLDPVLSIVISLVIAKGAYRVLKESLSLSLHGVPEKIELRKVREFLMAQEKVIDVHDLHVWAMSTTEIAMTCHLVTEHSDQISSAFTIEISEKLEKDFGICHSTIQVDQLSTVHGCSQIISE